MAERKKARAVPAPPHGVARVAWVGPGFLWMVSAAGSGELLFTPRIGALFGYAFVWALLAAVALKWVINRELGRLAVCTGGALFDSLAHAGWGWVLWPLLVPQLVVAVATIAGLASSAATALILALPGGVPLWTVVSLCASTALVTLGRYALVERAATVLAALLGVAATAAALSVGPDWGRMAAGLGPAVPAGARMSEVLPWLGFMLSGAAGLIWYSHWLPEKRFGAAPTLRKGEDVRKASTLSEADVARLSGWVRQMTLDNTVAVVGTLVVTLAFLVLGAELLQPRGLVPEEDRVARVLGRLLGDVWGRFGFWFMVLGVFVGFWDTVLADQDGFGRMYATGTRLLLGDRLSARWRDEERLRRAYVLVLLTAAPLALALVVGEPVTLLKLAGGVEAAHIPVVAAATVLLNRRLLPERLRPGIVATSLTWTAALFFAGFAGFYVYDTFS